MNFNIRSIFAFAVFAAAFSLAQAQRPVSASKQIKAKGTLPAQTLRTSSETTPSVTRVAPASTRRAVARKQEAITAPRARKAE